MSTDLPENARHEGTCSIQSNMIQIQIQIVNKTGGTFSSIDSTYFWCYFLSKRFRDFGVWMFTGVSGGSKVSSVSTRSMCGR